MRFRILAAGKPSLSYAKNGVEEYLKRLSRYGSYDLEYLKAGDSEPVSRQLLLRSSGSYRIALDERGKALTTRQWLETLGPLEDRGEVKTLAFLIGASDGHTEQLRREAQEVWSLAPITLQHELALVVLLEQLYRIATLRKGEPYHR